MKVCMNLRQRPFDSISSGRKTVEMRLNDEKRQGIKAGDFIEFFSPEGDKITAGVIRVRRFSSFEEVYAFYPLPSLGYVEGESGSPADMLAYYSKEEIAKYGVAAIEISI